MQNMVASLISEYENTSEFSSKCCIYKVPVRICFDNKTPYSPRVISIGPLHRGTEDLEAMEQFKLLYLKSFLKRTGSLLEDHVNLVELHEKDVRDHYAEKFEDIGSPEFVKMVVVDSIFLLELLWRYNVGNIEDNDRVLKKPWKVQDVRYDLMLLENQIPFFMLEEIFSLSGQDKSTLMWLTYKFFMFKAYLGKPDDDMSFKSFMRRIGQNFPIMHFVDFFREFHLPAISPVAREIKKLRVPSASELYKAGVKIKKGSETSMFNIEFKGRTLVIPQLRIGRSTESFLLNLVAYERCHLNETYVSDYLFVVNRLVDSVEAIELLAREGVIENNLVDHQDVVKSINSLARGSALRVHHFHFNDLCEGLDRYLNARWNWHKLWATIKQTHFSSLLTSFYVAVAFSIFVLTFIQTICSCGVQFQ